MSHVSTKNQSNSTQLFRKIIKLKEETAGDWFSKLQIAVLATNTDQKKSTGFTPFRLMFGREPNSDYFLEYLNSDVKNSQATSNHQEPGLTEIDHPNEEETTIADQDVFDISSENELECIDEFHSLTSIVREKAQMNIRCEQKRQKTI